MEAFSCFICTEQNITTSLQFMDLLFLNKTYYPLKTPYPINIKGGETKQRKMNKDWRKPITPA